MNLSDEVSERLYEFLASAGLIIFNAVAFYELLAPLRGLISLRTLYNEEGTWRGALRRAFEMALGLSYDRIFGYTLKVIDAIPPSPSVERALEEIYKSAEYVVSHAALFRHDLIGRIYHSTLGRDLAKAYATYYTGIAAAELLANLAVDNYDSKVVDFACGSGTLLVAAYHRKLALAYLQGYSGSIADLHRKFIEEDLWGFDAMAFAAHMASVNLALQEPTIIFKKFGIFHVPCGNGRLGSLDLLKGRQLKVLAIKLVSKEAVGPKRVGVGESEVRTVEVPEDGFDVVMMNPPFTRVDRASRILNVKEVAGALKRLDSELAVALARGGLPIAFVKLGDLYVKEGGRLALVLPSGVLSRESWLPIRRMLTNNYHIEYLVISWIPQNPAFSEGVQLREVLLVARKLREGEKAGHTVICHLDKAINFLNARRISESLKILCRNPQLADITDVGCVQRRNILYVDGSVGEAFTVPPAIMKTAVDNQYVLLAFRDPELLRMALSMLGLSSSGVEYVDNVSRYLTRLDEIAKIGVFVRYVKSAGYRIVESKDVKAGYPMVSTSTFDVIEAKSQHYSWLVLDPKLKIKKHLTPDLGRLLIMRRMDVYASMRVAAIASKEPITGNVWIPIKLRELRSKDGQLINSFDVAKCLTLWFNSTLGLLSLLASREETRGAWCEWKMERVKKLRVLNPRELNWSSIKALLELWPKLSELKWDRVYNQLQEAVENPNHPRRILDETLIKTITGKSVNEDDLKTLYKKLRMELDLLRAVM